MYFSCHLICVVLWSLSWINIYNLWFKLCLWFVDKIVKCRWHIKMSQQPVRSLICFMNTVNITLLTPNLHTFGQFWHASTSTLIIVSSTFVVLCTSTHSYKIWFSCNKWLLRSLMTKTNQSYHITPHYYLITYIGAYKLSP